MHKPGHFGLGLAVGAPFVFMALLFGYPIWAAVVAIAAMAGALIPDVDQKGIVPFKHHGVTHTLIFGVPFALAVGGILVYLQRPVRATVDPFLQSVQAQPLETQLAFAAVCAVAAFLGFLSHLLSDAMSTAGGTLLIRPYYPFSDTHVRYGIADAGNLYYNYGFLTAGVTLQAVAVGGVVLLT